MLFTDLAFLLLFLPLFFLLYLVFPAKRRSWILLLASLLFIGWRDPLFLLFPLGVTLIAYLIGLTLRSCRDGSRARLFVLIMGIVFCAAPLLIFRFTPYFTPVDDFRRLSAFLPPLGLSFYTLEAISYLLQVYRGELRAEDRPHRLAAWLCLFLKIPAGPVTDYTAFRTALSAPEITSQGLWEGLLQFIRGLSKKLLLANMMGKVWMEICWMQPYQIPVATAWIGFFAFLFSLYYSLSGYADMACGLGSMLGLPLPRNFRHPFWAKSLRDFWNRTLCTVTNWIRHRIFQPVTAALPRWMALPVAMWVTVIPVAILCGGAPSYFYFALLTETLLLIEQAFLKHRLPRWDKTLRWLYTMVLTLPSLILLAFPNISASLGYLQAMLGYTAGGLVGNQGLYLLYSNGVFFLLCLFGVTPLPQRIALGLRSRAPGLHDLFRLIGGLLLLIGCLCALVGTPALARVL